MNVSMTPYRPLMPYPGAANVAAAPGAVAPSTLDTYQSSQAPPTAGSTPKPSFFASMVRKVEEGIASVVVALSNIPILAKIGYWFYGAATKPKSDTQVVPNEGQLAPNLVRGGQPTEKGFETLKRQGVQTVINLRPEANWEEPLVKQNGMKYVYFPLPAVGAPSVQQGLQFLSMVTDPANGKVYFHCQHGADRTGAMAAAYRIAVDGWTADQAIAEMAQYHFHTGFEDAKPTFVRQFAAYWASLSPAAKDQVLHRSAPGAAPATFPPFPDAGGPKTGSLPPAPPLNFRTGNRVNFLVGDDQTYASALKMIDGARQSIQFETFTFNGERGLGVAQALIRARQRGVNVQVVLDPKAMMVSDQKKLADMMIQAGIDVHLYDESLLKDPLVAIDHAKILLADGQTALVGGSNFDRWNKYDFNYQVQGPSVPTIAGEFTQSWQNSRALTGVLVNKPGLPPVQPVPQAVGIPAPEGDTAITITETAPKGATGAAPANQTYLQTLQAINSATKSIDVLMFTLDDPKEIDALKAAAARGVQVRVLLNPGSGGLLGKSFNIEAVRELTNAGIPVRWFKFPPGENLMHAKVAIFDGETLLGGSTNFVHSANQDNHELGVWLKGPVASQAEATFEDDWQNQSTPVGPLTFANKVMAGVMDVASRVV